MSTFVIVPGAWDTPAAMEPVIEPMESAGHAVIVVDLPCDDAAATGHGAFREQPKRLAELLVAATR